MLNNKKAREIIFQEAGTINIAHIKLSVEFKYIKRNTIDCQHGITAIYGQTKSIQIFSTPSIADPGSLSSDFLICDFLVVTEL
jgi:hypothetical protein